MRSWGILDVLKAVSGLVEVSRGVTEAYIHPPNPVNQHREGRVGLLEGDNLNEVTRL